MTRIETVFSDLKLLQHWDHLQKVLIGGYPYPITAEIDLTNRCNHDCFWCIDTGVRRNQAELKVKIVLETMAKLRMLGCENVVFKGGGEPLIHRDITKILEMAGSFHAFKIGVVTNGTMLKKVRELLARYATFIRISVDAATSETHRLIHRGHNFSDILHNIEQLVALRRTLDSNVQIGINYVIWKQNAEEISKAVDLYRDLGVDYIHFKMAIMENEILDDVTMNVISHQLRQAYRMRTRGFIINSKEVESYYLTRRKKPLRYAGKSWKHCIAPHIATTITADANVYPCCYLKEQKEYVFGNITQLDFENIHNSDMRKTIISERINKNHCRRFCKGRTSNMRYDYPNRIFNYLKLRDTMDEGFI